MTPGHPAFGSRVGARGDPSPPGKGPGCCGTAAWDLYAIEGSKREAAAGGRRRAAGSEQGAGAQPNPWREASAGNKIWSAKRPAQPRPGLDRVHAIVRDERYGTRTSFAHEGEGSTFRAPAGSRPSSRNRFCPPADPRSPDAEPVHRRTAQGALKSRRRSEDRRGKDGGSRGWKRPPPAAPRSPLACTSRSEPRRRTRYTIQDCPRRVRQSLEQCRSSRCPAGTGFPLQHRRGLRLSIRDRWRQGFEPCRSIQDRRLRRHSASDVRPTPREENPQSLPARPPDCPGYATADYAPVDSSSSAPTSAAPADAADAAHAAA